MLKKIRERGGGGVRVDMNKELKLLLKLQKKSCCENKKNVGGGPARGGGRGGCERRIEVIVKMKIYSSFFIS